MSLKWREVRSGGWGSVGLTCRVCDAPSIGNVTADGIIVTQGRWPDGWQCGDRPLDAQRVTLGPPVVEAHHKRIRVGHNAKVVAHGGGVIAEQWHDLGTKEGRGEAWSRCCS